MSAVEFSISRFFLSAAAGFLLAACGQEPAFKQPDAYSIAAKHPISLDKPAVDFFEGALLGNGGMGVVVSTRPDGVVLYFGHNNVWDIRISENHKEAIGTFQEVFDKVSKIPDTLKVLYEDPWFAKYADITAENYSKPYPRPFPCGSIVLGFDRRKAELLGHKLDIANGHCQVYLLDSARRPVTLNVFTEMDTDRLWMELVDDKGQPQPSLFNRIRLLPDPSTPREMPKYKFSEELGSGAMGFRQQLPYLEPDKYNKEKGHEKDKAFQLAIQTTASLEKRDRINWDGNNESMQPLEAAVKESNTAFLAAVELKEGNQAEVPVDLSLTSISKERITAARQKADSSWRQYWSNSAVQTEDHFLEQQWYHNLYFFNCAAKDGATTPGLFANWSYNKIGTAWHGDYHMNYNTQQPFWMTFSSNHLEKNLPYVNLVENLMDVSRSWAKDYYKLPGAYFPHSAYPVEMTINPYPVPHWGWEICETPWTVQGLWWHYKYSADTAFLRNRAYTPIREAVEFMVAYMQRPEARGGKRWKDDKYHIFPTIPPELYALRPGFAYNYDCTIDLTLTKFIFNAFKEMVPVLGTGDKDASLITQIDEILSKFPDYPTVQSEQYGEVMVSVPGEHDKVVYNVPLPLVTVFPGEEHGLHSDSATKQLLTNTYYNQQNEGGNDLVFINLQAARMGLLDIEKFKRQVNYSLLPNGTAADKVMQVHGRYSDHTNYAYMAPMGIWFENFAIPAVINECLMQSYTGTIELFPNWDKNKAVSFHQLRAMGAFLVSAELRNQKLQTVRILAEKGGKLSLKNPFGRKLTVRHNGNTKSIDADKIEMETQPGDELIFN